MLLMDKILNPNDGIFNAIKSLNILSMEWINQYTETLDLEYYYNISGDKELTFLGEKCDLPTIAKIIVKKFGDNWSRLYQAFYEEIYKPLENYRMEEIETPNISENIIITNTGSVKNDLNEDNTNTATSSSIDKHSTNIVNSGNTDNNVYGFNSSNAVNSNESIQKGTTIADLESNKHLNDSQGSNTSNKKSTNTETINTGSTNVKTQTGNRKLTRSGNIGVTTSQQMLESELKLREWNLFDKMFKDVDSILTQSIY